MKLIVAHQILISAGVALAAIFLVRSFSIFWLSGDPVQAVAAAASIFVGIALFAYLRTVREKAAREARDTPPR